LQLGDHAVGNRTLVARGALDRSELEEEPERAVDKTWRVYANLLQSNLSRLMTTTVAHELVQKSLVGEAVDSGPVAVFVADDDERYLAVNAYACELLGYDRDELLELRVTDVAVNDSAAADYLELRRRGVNTGLTTLRCKDGTELSMNFRASQTLVGGMELYVGVCWPVDQPN
jgi:PAS domain S-box-containing protein